MLKCRASCTRPAPSEKGDTCIRSGTMAKYGRAMPTAPNDCRGKGNWNLGNGCNTRFRVCRIEIAPFGIRRIFFQFESKKAYIKAGFKREGILRDAVLDGDKHTDDMLMSILIIQIFEIFFQANALFVDFRSCFNAYITVMLNFLRCAGEFCFIARVSENKAILIAVFL